MDTVTQGETQGEEKGAAVRPPRITGLRALRGPSVWSRSPAVVARVEGADARVVAETALALQRAVGLDVSWYRVGPVGPPPGIGDASTVAVAYAYEAVAARALRLAAESLGVTDEAVAELRAVLEDELPGPTTLVLLDEARRRGIPAGRAPGETVTILGYGSRQRRMDATMTDRTSVLAIDVTSDRARTRRLLAHYGLPVPRGDVAYSAEEAVEIAEDIGFPALVKPLDASNGRGISGRLDDAAQVREAYALARAEHPGVVVERFVSGRDHRVLVVDGRVVAVTERVPAHVVGDGAASTGTGGTLVDRTDEIHPDNAAICAYAADVTGLDIAGVDVVTDDIAAPFRESGATIVAVNASPGIRMHTEPVRGTPRDATGAVLDSLFPPGAPCRVPITTVTGTNGKTTTTRLIAHLWRAAGHRVGFTTTDGVYVGERLLYEGDMTGPMGADMVLAHPRVDVAVLEVARGGILRSGLGFDGCDVGVVLNVSADHLGLDGVHNLEQLAYAKGTLVEVVRDGGCAVLNAEDARVLALRGRAAGEVALFCARPLTECGAVAEHVAAGGRAASVEPSGALTLHGRGAAVPVANVAELPMTLGGAARFQVQNAAAAALAAWVGGLPADVLGEALRTFVPSEHTTPGRMNRVLVRGASVVVDYAHNPAALAALRDYALRVPCRRRLGVVAIPGDRADEAIRAFGAAAVGLDRVVFKEHPKYRRGRPAGETAALMRAGYLEAGGDAARTTVVLDEGEAARGLVGELQPGDLALFVADDLAATLAALRDENL